MVMRSLNTNPIDEFLVAVIDVVGSYVGELDSVISSDSESRVDILDRLGLDELFTGRWFIALDSMGAFTYELCRVRGNLTDSRHGVRKERRNVPEAA